MTHSKRVLTIFTQVLFLYLLTGISLSFANEGLLYGCQPLELKPVAKPVSQFGQGILFQLEKPTGVKHYIFGTIHASDPVLLQFPETVIHVLQQAEQFVMEALPSEEKTIEDLKLLQEVMFYQDGGRLDHIISPLYYQRTVEILKKYHIPKERIFYMRPWAAFLVMNYPPPVGEGVVMDLNLLSKAKQSGLALYGLETFYEQIRLFADLSESVQIKLLTDSLCHYDTFQQDFEAIKMAYLNRDLSRLVGLVEKYTLVEQKVYQDLYHHLLIIRNIKMVEKIGPIFKKGSTFVAVGALHLIGEKGIISQLEQQGYQVTRLY